MRGKKKLENIIKLKARSARSNRASEQNNDGPFLSGKNLLHFKKHHQILLRECKALYYRRKKG